MARSCVRPEAVKTKRPDMKKTQKKLKVKSEAISSSASASLSSTDKRPSKTKTRRPRRSATGGAFEETTEFSVILLRVKVFRGLGRPLTLEALRRRFWRDVNNK